MPVSTPSSIRPEPSFPEISFLDGLPAIESEARSARGAFCHDEAGT